MAARKTKKGDTHELTDMEVEFVSLVPKGANRQERFLMVKTGQTVKLVPPSDATPEVKQTARQARSKKYGIEVLAKGSALSYPSGFPTTETMYGDPVNLKYPWGDQSNSLDMGRLRNGIARFKQNADTYTETTSKAVVFERIVRKAIAEGVDVSFDPEDELDSLLPQDLKDQLTEKGDDSDGGEEPPADPPEDGETPPQEDTAPKSAAADLDAWMEQVLDVADDLLIEAGVAKEEPEPEPEAPEVGTGQASPEPTVKSDDEAVKLQRQIAKLQKEKDESERALARSKEALRKSQLRAAKIRKNTIGASSRLVTGEVSGGEHTLDGPEVDHELVTTWQSGGDLAGGNR